MAAFEGNKEVYNFLIEKIGQRNLEEIPHLVDHRLACGSGFEDPKGSENSDDSETGILTYFYGCSLFQMAQINTLKAKALQKGYTLCKIIASFLHSQANEIDTITSILLTDLKIINYFAQRQILLVNLLHWYICTAFIVP